MEDRIIVLTTKFYNDYLISMHALEIIEFEMTGIYFHAYFNKDKLSKDDMYYYSEYDNSDDKYYLENFKNFVKDSKIIVYENKEIKKLQLTLKNFKLEIKINDLTSLKIEHKNEKLIELAKKYYIYIEKNTEGEGLIDCTVLGRIICKSKKSIDEIKMTGKKPVYFKEYKERKVCQINENNIKKKINKVNKVATILNTDHLVAIDTDTTGLSQENDKLIAIHAVEIKEGKLTGLFFHAFINRRNHNYDYMYYLASYNYCLDVRKKITTFLKFTKNKILVSHNKKFDIGFINKTLLELEQPTIDINKCYCTMNALSWLLINYRLKDCAYFYNIKIKDEDFHKGIVDVVVLGRIICKMVENNDELYNIEKYCNKKYISIHPQQDFSFKSEENVIEDKKRKDIKNEENEIEDKKRKDKQNMIENKKIKDGDIKVIVNGEERIYNENEIYVSKYGKKYHLRKCGNMISYIVINKATLLKNYNLKLCLKCAKFYNIEINS